MCKHADVTDDAWNETRKALALAGVAGTGDFGRFVSNTEFFGPSLFDERAAMPVLLEILPTLADPKVVSAVAGHLRRPWARPTAFGPLHDAYLRWAPSEAEAAAWALGAALATAATEVHLERLLVICQDRAFGKSRQMVVASLGRYRRHPAVLPVLLDLLDDGDVGLHAMIALRRVLGPAGALPHVEATAQRQRSTPLGDTAVREARRMRKAIED